jgi:glycerophosphoryl diester phosphodiesterase
MLDDQRTSAMTNSIKEILENGRRPLIIAHRGASFYYPENTIDAFEAAIDMRAEMIEFDVRRTADGVLVVHHDLEFAGVEIQTMSKTWLEEAEESAGYSIPTLVEILELCRGKVPLDIELKEPGYEEQVLETVLDILEPNSFIITSFQDTVLRKVKARAPEVRTGLILGNYPRWQLISRLFPGFRARRAGVDVLMVSQKLLPFGFLSTTKNLGLPVWVYTVNDRKKLWKFITDGRIAGIFTDRPDVALFLRDLHSVHSESIPEEKGPGNGVSE